MLNTALAQTLAFPKPPWAQTPVPQVTTAMESVYDWNQHAMRETYHDACVPIFQTGSMWSCDFVNVNNTSFLLQVGTLPPPSLACRDSRSHYADPVGILVRIIETPLGAQPLLKLQPFLRLCHTPLASTTHYSVLVRYTGSKYLVVQCCCLACHPHPPPPQSSIQSLP